VGSGFGVMTRSLTCLGYSVSGLDDDPQQIRGARVISSIEKVDVSFECVDLDYEDFSGSWDVVLLFDVFQNFAQPEAAARRLAGLCRREIYLEAGLTSDGYKWQGRWYRRLSAWSCQNEAELIALFLGWFPGFECLPDRVETGEGRRLYCLKRKVGGD